MSGVRVSVDWLGIGIKIFVAGFRMKNKIGPSRAFIYQSECVGISWKALVDYV